MPAGAATHLHNIHMGNVPGCTDNLGNNITIEQKMLPQRLARCKPMARNHFTQRRKHQCIYHLVSTLLRRINGGGCRSHRSRRRFAARISGLGGCIIRNGGLLHRRFQTL